jgi:RNA polymerase sigma-70 factor (ECF subfamily)
LTKKIKIPEEDLIILLKNKDQRGFTILYDNYAAALYGIILKVVKAEEVAADVMQEAFVKIWKNIEAYEKGKGTLFTWILNISRNLAIDKTRSSEFRQNSQIRNIDENVNIIEKRIETQQQVETQTDLIGIENLIGKLKPEYQVIIELVYFKGYTQTEVAEELEVPLGTVKTRIKAAITQLKSFVT